MGSLAPTKKPDPWQSSLSLSRSRYNMEILLVLTLTLATVLYATPVQLDNNLVSPTVVTSADTAAPVELHRSRRSIHGCAYQVTIKGAMDHGPGKLHKEYYGTYTIQLGSFSGRDWYKKDGHAIWYNRDKGDWVVGPAEAKGGDKGWFYTNDDDDCPHQPGFSWKFFVSAIDEWIDAGTSMSIYSAS